MDDCPICEQPNRYPGLDDALKAEPNIGVVAVRYRLRKALIANHRRHQGSESFVESGSNQQNPVIENPGDDTHTSTLSLSGLDGHGALRHLLRKPLAESLDELPAVDETVLGEANLQDTAERHFRTGWKLMNDPRRAKNLVWLQEQLREVSYEVSFE